ncbi:MULTISPECIES: hypothetical protein [Myxococcaceae]|nr:MULTISPECIES: hypothetical protein [Myxococcaceae]
MLRPHGFNHFLHESDLEFGGAFVAWLAFICLTLAVFATAH